MACHWILDHWIADHWIANRRITDRWIAYRWIADRWIADSLIADRWIADSLIADYWITSTGSHQLLAGLLDRLPSVLGWIPDRQYRLPSALCWISVLWIAGSPAQASISFRLDRWIANYKFFLTHTGLRMAGLRITIVSFGSHRLKDCWILLDTHIIFGPQI